jgi:hypothetical protein
MIRLLAAALLFAGVAVPAFACDYNKSVSTETDQSTVASQPGGDHAVPANGTATARQSPS